MPTSTSDRSRRSVLRGAFSAAAVLGSAGALKPQELSRSTVQIIDTGWGLSEPVIRSLAEAGVLTAMRYYSQEENLPGKNITRTERAMLRDHGMSVGIVYQFKGQAQGRYVAESGVTDAAFCLERAQAIGQPDGSVIFFGIDNDRHDLDGVKAYLRSVQKAFGGRFRVGVYGSGYHCAAVLDAGLAVHAWVPEAPAWRGTREFVNARRWSLFQNKTNVSSSAWMAPHDIPIDTNLLAPGVSEIGSFGGDGSIVRYDNIDTQIIALSRRFVIAPDGVAILDRPTANATERTRMCVARTLHVLGTENGYAVVDIDEDGEPDGYCRMEALAPLNEMPRYRSGCTPPKI